MPPGETPSSSQTEWQVYILRCADGSLYTGITTDLQRRLTEHNQNQRGARYTRSRRPVSICYSVTVSSRTLASRLEYRIKRLPLKEKHRIMAEDAALTLLECDVELSPRIAKSGRYE